MMKLYPDLIETNLVCLMDDDHDHADDVDDDDSDDVDDRPLS